MSIITGSAQGLGKAFAIRLLAAGAKVVANVIANVIIANIIVVIKRIGLQIYSSVAAFARAFGSMP